VNTCLAGISFCIQNCNSLNVTTIKNQDIKISAVVNYGTDVILLSDTRMNGKDLILSEKFRLRYKMYANSTRNSRGVAVLISNNIHHEVLETIRDPDENYILLRLVIRDTELIIGSVYGPNVDAGCEIFYDNLQNRLAAWRNVPIIIGGDWNATYSDLDVNENPDVLFMRNIPSRIRSGMVGELCRAVSVTDPFRTLNPDLKEFTYNPSGVLRKNRSRIDFFLITDDLYAQLEKCNIAQGYCKKTFDHKPVFLSFKKRRGNGRMSVSNSTVSHKFANDIVRIAVYFTILSVCIPVAGALSLQILETEYEKVAKLNNLINDVVLLEGMSQCRELEDAERARLVNLEAEMEEDWRQVAPLEYLYTFERQVKDDVYFELLIGNTRKSLLDLQSHIRSSEKKLVRVWTAELAGLKNADYVRNIDRILQLEGLLNEASERYVLERVNNFVKTDLLNNEKMTPRYLRIAESFNPDDQSKIRDDNGVPFVSGKDRNTYIRNFYKNLYAYPEGARIDFNNCVQEFLGDLVNHPVVIGSVLTEGESMALEADVTLEELDEAVITSNLNSAPGIDGISNRYIRKFWIYFREPLLWYTRECLSSGVMTETFNTALIKLIPKKGDCTQIKNWRPISLLSCFYKIISRVVNSRLDKVIDKVTSMAQKAYNSKRYIHESVINTVDVIRHCEVNGISGVILSIDQGKAFDSVLHGYMREVYRFFGFGPRFIKFMDTIGTRRTARIMFDTGTSDPIDLERGFAQGNSPSPRKYNIGEQILLFRLEYDPNIIGV